MLSLLTDPAASLLGGSRNNREDGQDDAAESRGASKAGRGLDDAATESRIQASLEAEEDSLMGLFGKKEPSRPQRAAPQPEPVETPPAEPEAQGETEPDPRTLELLSMLSNPSTLGNSTMPTFAEEPPRPAALDFDFADELTAGMAEQPAPEPEPEPDWPPQPAAPPAQQAAPQPAQQPAPQYAQQPTPQPVQQAAPQPAMSLEKQAAPQYVQQPAPQYARQPTPQPAQQQPAPPIRQTAQQPAPQYAQQAAPPAPQPAPQSSTYAQHPATAHDYEQFVCFNLTQALVEEKADKLMKQFGMCTCNRCKVDVTAIALSNLPAKYVAMQNRDILPLLSMYEERYSAAVTVQVMSACRMVMKRPHHGR
ncbi:MAG: late competence development ComFB family protein [Oscillibacter sp.]|nr:late competence development ComFB family protein [Oscillibacter sp.]